MVLRLQIRFGIRLARLAVLLPSPTQDAPPQGPPCPIGRGRPAELDLAGKVWGETRPQTLQR